MFGKYLHFLLLFVPLFFLLASCSEKESESDTGIGKPPDPSDTSSTFYRAMDLSFQPELISGGVQYQDGSGTQIDLLPFVENAGVNLIRLRLWHTPNDDHSSLEEVVSYAQQVNQAGMDILLDIHFSDTWADPGNQQVPNAWEGLEIEMLKDSIYNYSKRVMDRFKSKNTLPVIVQIGNETNSGFLWNAGRVGGAFNENWPAYAALTNSAIAGIKSVDVHNEIDILIHYAGFNGIEWFMEQFQNYNVDFDIIGISYYSIWHEQDFTQVQSELASIAQSFSQKILVVETSYPWTLEWNDWTDNIWGLESQLIPGYAATPEGQKSYLIELKSILKNLPNNKGIGFCYWAPDWVAYKGPEATDGSIWENATVFDFEYKALPAIEAFNAD